MPDEVLYRYREIPRPAVTSILILIFCFSCSQPVVPEPDLTDRNTYNTTSLLKHSDQTAAMVTADAKLPVTMVIVGEARDQPFFNEQMQQVSELYQQCGIDLQTTVRELPNEIPKAINVADRYRLTTQYAASKPTVFVIESNAERDVAFSYLPSINRDISGTAWVTNRVSEPCFAWVVAHEIGHLVLNDATHHPNPGNIMNARCSAGNNFNRSTLVPQWSNQQCALMNQRPTRSQ